MPTNSEYVEIAKIQNEILQEWYPYIQFGKYCLAYCESQCDCAASISMQARSDAYKLARERYEKKEQS